MTPSRMEMERALTLIRDNSFEITHDFGEGDQDVFVVSVGIAKDALSLIAARERPDEVVVAIKRIIDHDYGGPFMNVIKADLRAALSAVVVRKSEGE